MSKKKNNKVISLANKIVSSKNSNDIYNVINTLLINNFSQVNDIINVIVRLLQEKDDYTKSHSIRVTYYSYLIAKEMHLDENDILTLQLAALLHDIGKIGVSDRVLKKPGKLTSCEYLEMKEHPMKAVKVLENIESLKHLIPYIRSHHERYDGSGYPDGIKGEDIPIFSRIILVADTADAMMSTRPYRKGLDLDTTIDELKRCSGSQFDPKIVNHFINAIEKYNKSKKAS